MSASHLRPRNTERFDAFTEGAFEQVAAWTDNFTPYCETSLDENAVSEPAAVEFAAMASR